MYNLKELFPATQTMTYLNTAAHGLISQSMVDRKAALNEKMLRQASRFTDQRGEILHEVRKTLANFMGSEEHLTALVPNFSLAFNALLEGIDSAQKFLLVQGDYPSVNWPVEARGFECCYATLDEKLEEHIWNACDQHRPDFLAFSLVQYISGVKIDLDFLKKLKTDFPDLIIIADATQYIGVEEFRFRESGIDIIAASCYKWLHAGDGNAFIAFKESIVNRIKPKFTGFNSVQGFKNDRGSFMGHFEPGHQDILAFDGLQQAVNFMQDYGMSRVQQQTKELAVLAKNELKQRNLLQPMVVQRQYHSSIFNIAGGDALFKALLDQDIIVSQRGEGIRVSFSFINTVDDLSKLLNTYDAFQ